MLTSNAMIDSNQWFVPNLSYRSGDESHCGERSPHSRALSVRDQVHVLGLDVGLSQSPLKERHDMTSVMLCSLPRLKTCHTEWSDEVIGDGD